MKPVLKRFIVESRLIAATNTNTRMSPLGVSGGSAHPRIKMSYILKLNAERNYIFEEMCCSCI